MKVSKPKVGWRLGREEEERRQAGSQRTEESVSAGRMRPAGGMELTQHLGMSEEWAGTDAEDDVQTDKNKSCFEVYVCMHVCMHGWMNDPAGWLC